MLKKAASGVLAILPCSRTESTLRASKGLRPCWIDPSERLRACFFEHSLQLDDGLAPLDHVWALGVKYSTGPLKKLKYEIKSIT